MEAASRVIEQGPGEQLCSKFYADQIVKAGQFLGQAKRKAETDNEQQLDRADKIKKLQSDKVVWPVILDVIHSSLPQQEPEISRAVAEGPTAYKALIDSNPDKYARAKRKQIFIEKFDASYSSDVLSKYDETYNSLKGSSTGGGGTPGAKSTTAPAQKGFVIRLVGRTPFAAGDRRKAYAFLKEGLLADIQKSGEQKEFYFAKTNLLPIRQFGSGSDRRSSAGGATMRPGDIGDIATVRDGSSNKDFVTGETLVNDWQFEMLFAVILGPKPAEPEA